MDQWLGKLIVSVTNKRSPDGQAEFRHSGMVTSIQGDTYEALWRFGRQNLYTDYLGHKIIIGRHRDMTPEGFEYAHRILSEKYEGKIYPVLRLLAHGTTVTAKWTPMFRPVCSELTRLFWLLAGCRDYPDEEFKTFSSDKERWEWAHKKAKGYTPDNQADSIRGDDLIDVIQYGSFVNV
jgi:hypothetical protein